MIGGVASQMHGDRPWSGVLPDERSARSMPHGSQRRGSAAHGATVVPSAPPTRSHPTRFTHVHQRLAPR
jgi:hypothetical protein